VQCSIEKRSTVLTIIEHEILSIGSLAATGRVPQPDRTWRLESPATPRPLHPLEYDLTSEAAVRAFNTVAPEYGLPVEAAAIRLGGYAYRSYTVTAAAAELEARTRHALGRLHTAATTVGQRWDHEHMPALEAQLAFWQDFHLRGATITALIAHFDATMQHLEQAWRIASEAGLSSALAPQLLAELHGSLFGEAAAGEVGQLLQGIESGPRALDRALRALAADARVRPYVREALQWCADHEVIEVLLASDEGRAFLKPLRALLRDGRAYGEPGRIEDPLPLVRRLKQYVRQPDLLAAGDDGAARRVLEAEIDGRLAPLPAELQQQYATTLAAAQEAVRVRDERAAAIERVLAEVRRVMLELGRRFAEAGTIALAGDVFYLQAFEVRQAAETMPWVDMRPRIVRRRGEIERARLRTPLLAFGATLAPDDVERRLYELAYTAA
jgi:hypothetical protein